GHAPDQRLSGLRTGRHSARHGPRAVGGGATRLRSGDRDRETGALPGRAAGTRTPHERDLGPSLRSDEEAAAVPLDRVVPLASYNLTCCSARSLACAIIMTHAASPAFEVDHAAALERLLRFLAVPGITGQEEAIGREIVAALVEAGVPPGAITFDDAQTRIPEPTQTGNLIVKLPG